MNSIFTRKNMQPPLADKSVQRLVALGLVATVVAAWMLLHPYLGMEHDSNLYALAALSRLYPLGEDVFLRFGSQDAYTIFSPLFATAIRLFGLDMAGSLLTLIAHLLFFVAGGLLARRFMSPRMALLSVGLLVTLPSVYASYRVFNYIEPFITPRQIAEAFVLFALAAAWGRRYVWTTLCMLFAVLLHPIMAAAGVGLLTLSFIALPRPRLALALGAAGIAGLTLAALLLESGPFSRFDPQWFEFLRDRNLFMFVSEWSATDWLRNAVPLALLAVGSRILTSGTARAFCRATVLTALCGVGLAWIACDLLHVIIVTQAQVWRWLWLSNTVAVVLLPLIAVECWNKGTLAQAAFLGISAAWIFPAPVPLHGMILAGFCATLPWCEPSPTDARYGRLVLMGMSAILAIASIMMLADKLSVLQTDASFFDKNLPLTLQRIWMVTRGGVLAGIALIAVWWLSTRLHTRARALAFLIASLTAIAVLFPVTLKIWTPSNYSKRLQALYAPLRALIPPGSDVLWPSSPLGAWYLLQRPSYISDHQTAGVVFARQTGIELQRRAASVAPLLPEDAFGRWTPKIPAHLTPKEKLMSACRTSDVPFIVSWDDMGLPPLAAIHPNDRHPNIQLRLYRCKDVRS